MKYKIRSKWKKHGIEIIKTVEMKIALPFLISLQSKLSERKFLSKTLKSLLILIIHS